MRTRPSNRRPSWTVKFVWRNAHGVALKFFGTISFDGPPHAPDFTRPLEIFINSAKATSDAQAAAQETAIFASFALQHGATVQELLQATVHDENGNPATPVGQLLAMIDAGLIVPTEAA